MSKLTSNFYLRDDVVQLSRELLGKVLCTDVDGSICKSFITETEAYAGIDDKASHAYGGKFTERTKIMYAKGGHSYVYLCYGIHYLFNVVTNTEQIPHAILIRSIKPLEGMELMLQRRKQERINTKTFVGPGKVSQAMGIDLSHNGLSLLENKVWIEDHQIKIPDQQIIRGPRVGTDYAGEDALLPYRFVWSKS